MSLRRLNDKDDSREIWESDPEGDVRWFTHDKVCAGARPRIRSEPPLTLNPRTQAWRTPLHVAAELGYREGYNLLVNTSGVRTMEDGPRRDRKMVRG